MNSKMKQILQSLVSEIRHLSPVREDDTLTFNDYYVKDPTLFKDLACACEDGYDLGSVKQGLFLPEYHLTISKLRRFGFFLDKVDFVNNYDSTKVEIAYIDEIGKYSNEEDPFFNHYSVISDFRSSLRGLKPIVYLEGTQEHFVICNGESYADLSMAYSVASIDNLNDDSKLALQSVAAVFNLDDNVEKESYIAATIDFIKGLSDKSLTRLIEESASLFEMCKNTFIKYINNHSITKLLQDIDERIYAYSTRLRDTISSIQAKLVVIPAVYILAGSYLDYSGDIVNYKKNIVLIVSLTIFAVLMQILINNQFDEISRIHDEIMDYEKEFIGSNNQLIVKRFSRIEQDEDTQRNRLILMMFIIWLIPPVLFALIYYLTYRSNTLPLFVIILSLLIISGSVFCRFYPENNSSQS